MRLPQLALSALIAIGIFAGVLAGASVGMDRAAGLAGAISADGLPTSESRPVPEFPTLAPSSWAGPPTSIASLRGRVILLNVWTLGCVNCRRTLPWVASVHGRFGGKGLAVIGVHSPEFEYENDLREVERARTAHGLGYPSFLDSGLAYWRALGNRYWPTIYLIDKAGTIRRVQIGEVHAGDDAAIALEQEIARLLAEPAPAPTARP